MSVLTGQGLYHIKHFWIILLESTGLHHSPISKAHHPATAIGFREKEGMLLRKEKFHHVIPRATWRVRKEKNHLHCKPFCLLFSYDGVALLGLWK